MGNLTNALEGKRVLIVGGVGTGIGRAITQAVGAAGAAGAIVSVGSTAGVFGMPHGTSYGAAKAGLISLCKSLSAEYGRRGIRMNVINCGPIATASAAIALKQGAALENIPLGRAGHPEEI